MSDVVDAFMAAALSDVRNEILNVGTGNPQSVNRLAELLAGEKSISQAAGEPTAPGPIFPKFSR